MEWRSMWSTSMDYRNFSELNYFCEWLFFVKIVQICGTA
jgi:hypothetical protein